jgi:hypothetical protein
MATDHHPLDRLDVSSRVLKRAQYEALAFFIRPPYVEVQNHSYPDPETHTYRVRIADGLPINCSCPADVEYERACKHRVGVAIRPKILDMAIEAQVAADGGAAGEQDDSGTATDDDAETDSTSARCECHPADRLPCWPCVAAGRTSFPERDRTDPS